MVKGVKERLIEYIESKRISKNRFEQICGLSTRYVSNISKSIQPDKIERISLNFPDLNIGWLLTGKGTMLNGEDPITALANRMSTIICDFEYEDLSEIASFFGLKDIELSNFTNNFVAPPHPFDFVKFVYYYPEYNYMWIITGVGERFNEDENLCLRRIKEKIHRKNHPEYYPPDRNPENATVSEKGYARLWSQIDFLKSQLKEKDSQIEQLLSILKDNQS